MSNIGASEKIKHAVRQVYGEIAGRALGGKVGCCGPVPSAGCCGPTPPSGCCGTSEAALADAARLYSTEELASLPESVTGAALGCGNPTAIADLRPGEVVLDLGSGGGIDCFLAAKKVGPQGRVIGLDMTPEMVLLAQRNAKKVGATNVEFRYGEMEDIPLPDGSVDVIISNCVINLSPDKDAVFREAYRVLRPGGRMSISDIVLHGELPPAIRESLEAWAGCVAGALEESDYLAKMRAAGFVEVKVESRAYGTISQDPEWASAVAELTASGFPPDALDRALASVRVTARKPA